METVGRDYIYNPKEYIGHGAFAMVYKGTCVSNPKKTVAIKNIVKKKAQTRAKEIFFDKEIAILQELTKLNHENLVALYAVEDRKEVLHLIMEYCNGGDLADYMNSKGTLSEGTIRLFLVQIAAAMEALQNIGVIHRDLKPQNILLHHSGPQPCMDPSRITLKIADFGFARFLQDGVMAATMCGSPMYMAPEVIMNMTYTAKVDLWSIGTIIYQCLVGQAPYRANNPIDLKKHYEKFHDKLEPLIPPGTSPELTHLLMNLLKFKADERIAFERFFSHPFLKPEGAERVPSPLLMCPGNDNFSDSSSYSNNQFRRFVDPRILSTRNTDKYRESWKIENTDDHLGTSPEEADDFVLVPPDLPVDMNAPGLSPTRPCSLPIAVPHRQAAYNNSPRQPHVTYKKENDDIEKENSGNIPRSQPMNMKRTTSKELSPIEIHSISPPSIQYNAKTPTGITCMIPETPPPDNHWTVVSPGNSPLRKSLANSPLTYGQLASNNTNQLPLLPFNQQFAENNIGTIESNMRYSGQPQDASLERVHNETLARLNYILALCDCINDIPLKRNKVDQRLALSLKMLQLLSSALNLATQNLENKTLQPTTTVKSVIGLLNAKFRNCIVESKKMNSPKKIQLPSRMAEKILYQHALKLCHDAALEELFQCFEYCFQKYQTAQIIFHSLASQLPDEDDKIILNKYKAAVELRLSVLQQKGLTPANTASSI